MKFSKPPKKIIISNQTVVYLIDNTWKLDYIVLKDYGLGSIGGLRCVLVVIYVISKF